MEKLLSTCLMVSVGKLLTEYMWCLQHFKYIYFLSENIGEQPLLPNPQLQVPTPLPLRLPLPDGVESSLSYTRGLPLMLPMALSFSSASAWPGPITGLVSFHSTPLLPECGGKITIWKKQKHGFWWPHHHSLSLLTFSKSFSSLSLSFFTCKLGPVTLWAFSTSWEYCQDPVVKSMWIGCDLYDSWILQVVLFLLAVFLPTRLTHIHSSVPILTDSVGRKNRSTGRWVKWSIWHTHLKT